MKNFSSFRVSLSFVLVGCASILSYLCGRDNGMEAMIRMLENKNAYMLPKEMLKDLQFKPGCKEKYDDD